MDMEMKIVNGYYFALYGADILSSWWDLFGDYNRHWGGEIFCKAHWNSHVSAAVLLTQ